MVKMNFLQKVGSSNGAWIGGALSVIYLYISTSNNIFDIRDILIRVSPGGFSTVTGGFITATWLSFVIGMLIGFFIEQRFKK